MWSDGSASATTIRNLRSVCQRGCRRACPRRLPGATLTARRSARGTLAGDAEEPPAAPVPEQATRPLRADAARNRQRILEAAEEVFARDGIAVPIDTVAERAGVGVGTLYRHFPTKEALFEAVVLRRLDELLAAVTEPADDATASFFAFLEQMGEQVALKHDLFDALAEAGVDLEARCAAKVGTLKEEVRALHGRAVAHGGVRADITADEVMGLVIGACSHAQAPGAVDDSTRRMVRVVCDGLRTDR